MSIQAKLIIDDKEIKVLSYRFTFKQGADSTGRPATKPVFTGIRVVVESQSDVDYTKWAIADNQTKLVKLEISPIILGGKTRTLLFIQSHLVKLHTHFSAKGTRPMTETLFIRSAAVKDSNSTTTYKAYWLTERVDAVPVKTINYNELGNEPTVIQASWQNNQGDTIKETTYGEQVSLMAEIDNPEGGTAKITITKEDGTEFENGEKSFTYVEAVDDDGLAEISEIDIKEQWEAFKKADVDKLVAKVDYKGAKKTSKPLKVTPPPKVLVDFRPKSNWNAEFGFDWLRMDDTSHFGDNKYEDIVSKQYTDSTHTTLERNQNKYKGSFKKDAKQFEKLKEKYGTFDISWKTKTDASGNKVQEKHVVQWLALKNGKTAELKLLLDIEEKADYLEFEDNEYFEFTPKKIDISGKGKGQNKKLSDPVSIKCKKEFTTDQEIIVKAYLKTDPKKGIIAGKIKAWANDTTKQKQKKVVFIEIKTPAISTPRKLKANAINEKSRINKYLNQAFIQLHPDSEIIDLDLSTDTDFVQFIKSQKITKKSITDATKKLITFLKSKLDSKYDTFFKAFYFAENGYHPNGNLSGYSAANADYVVVFKSANDQTAVHELLHAFNLTHTFANNEASANAEFTYEYKKTDNLLDYSHHPNNNNKRRSLWYWQWIKANNSI